MRPSFRHAHPAYRPVLKLLHWSAFATVAAALVLGNGPLIGWLVPAIAVLWTIGFGAFGLMARPGPALTGILRNYFVPLHLLLLGLFDIFALLVHSAEAGPLTGPARNLCLAVLALGCLHGCFHLWRHTALGDGALRNMMPKFMHGML